MPTPGEINIDVGIADFENAKRQLAEMERLIKPFMEQQNQGIKFTKDQVDQFTNLNKAYDESAKRLQYLTNIIQQATRQQAPQIPDIMRYYGAPTATRGLAAQYPAQYAYMMQQMGGMPPGGMPPQQPTEGGEGEEPDKRARGSWGGGGSWSSTAGMWYLKRWIAPAYLGYKALGAAMEGMGIDEQIQKLQVRIAATADTAKDFHRITEEMNLFKYASTEAVKPLERMQNLFQLMQTGVTPEKAMAMMTGPEGMEWRAKRRGLMPEQMPEYFGAWQYPLAKAGYTDVAGAGKMENMLLSTDANRSMITHVLSVFAQQMGQMRAGTFTNLTNEAMQPLALVFQRLTEQFPGAGGVDMAGRGLMGIQRGLTGEDERSRAFMYRAMGAPGSGFAGKGFFDWQKSLEGGLMTPGLLNAALKEARFEAGGDKETMGLILGKQFGSYNLAEALMGKAGFAQGAISKEDIQKAIDEAQKSDKAFQIHQAVTDSIPNKLEEMRLALNSMKTMAGEHLLIAKASLGGLITRFYKGSRKAAEEVEEIKKIGQMPTIEQETHYAEMGQRLRQPDLVTEFTKGIMAGVPIEILKSLIESPKTLNINLAIPEKYSPGNYNFTIDMNKTGELPAL